MYVACERYAIAIFVAPCSYTKVCDVRLDESLKLENAAPKTCSLNHLTNYSADLAHRYQDTPVVSRIKSYVAKWSFTLKVF